LKFLKLKSQYVLTKNYVNTLKTFVEKNDLKKNRKKFGAQFK